MIDWRRFYSLFKDVFKQYHLIYTLAALVTGFVAVGYAKLFELAEHMSHDLFTSNPYIMLIASPLCFVLSVWLVIRFAPGATGSGIPQVMAATEDADDRHESPLIEKFLSLRVIIIKIISSCICTLGGGAIGREGPTIQIGAGIFDVIARRFHLLQSRISEKYWIVTGGASGLAAAFNTPLGGLVYAIEELASPEFNKFKTYLISSVIIAGFSAQSITGRYLYVGYAVLGDASFHLIPITILLGIITGIGGALFGHWSGRWSRAIVQKSVNTRLLFAAGIGLLLALVGVFIHEDVFWSGHSSFQKILFDADIQSSPLIVLVRIFGPMISFASGVAGGIFAPALAAGAAIGGFLGHYLSDINTNILVILGMIGFLAGVTRAPFTSFVLVFEMTDRHSALFLMMLIALVASTIGKVVSANSVYTNMAKEMLERKNINIKTTDQS